MIPISPADTKGHVPTSLVLQRLHEQMPADRFTLGWLMHSLHKRSFEIIMLLLALVAITPGLSILAGLLLMIPAIQMIAGKPAPVFPGRIATRSFPPMSPCRRGAASGSNAWISRAGRSSTLAHTARGHQASGWRRRRAAERHAGIHSSTPQQRDPRFGDRLDLACLYRGRPALLSSPCWPPLWCWWQRWPRGGRCSPAPNGSSVSGDEMRHRERTTAPMGASPAMCAVRLMIDMDQSDAAVLCAS